MLLDHKLAPLQKTVRINVLGKYLGQLFIVLGFLTLVPLLVSVFFRDFDITFRYVIVELILFVFGFLLSRLDAPADIQTNEGMVITSLIFIISPLIMTIPITGSGLLFTDALFETISAVTTTGLSTVTNPASMPPTFQFSRAYMQWIGGLGIVVLTVALLLRPGMAARRLIHLEETDDLMSSTRAYARAILRIYVLLTAIATILIWATCGDFFQAITHAFAAVSTGGFSSYDDSLAGFDNNASAIIVIAACMFGALPLLLYQRLGRRDWKEFFLDIQLRAMIALVLIVSVLLGTWFVFQYEMPWSEALFHAPLLALSAQSTAGFSTLPLAEYENGVYFILIFSMFVGGSLGSTAGGIKILRLLTFASLVKLIMRKLSVAPHAVVKPELGRETLEDDEIIRALLFMLSFVLIIFLSWLAFVIAGYDTLSALFEVVSATGTVGLSSGITQSDMPEFLKLVLCVDMLLGRLEIVALLILFYPATWIRARIVA